MYVCMDGWMDGWMYLVSVYIVHAQANTMMRKASLGLAFPAIPSSTYTARERGWPLRVLLPARKRACARPTHTGRQSVTAT
jgi:hypothetical protein